MAAMQRQTFMTGPMSILLDLVRGSAALTVLLGHIIDFDMYTGPFPHGQLMAHNAVIVFFVLSGLVIAHSATSRPTTLREFAIARVARIVPTAWLAIVFAALMFVLAQAMHLPESLPPPHDTLNAATLLLPFLFLSEGVGGQGAVWNPPFWSLAYEVWFYALFASATFLRGRKRTLALAACALLAGWKVLLLLPIWLLGAALVLRPERSCIHPKSATFVLAAGAVMAGVAMHYAVPVMFGLLDVSGMTKDEWGFSNLFLTDTLLGAGIALMFVGLRPLAGRAHTLLARIEAPVRWLAGCSFTLYLMHMPILLIIRGNGIGVGDSMLGLIGLAGMVLAICALVANLVERRSPQLRRYLGARLGARQAASA